MTAAQRKTPTQANGGSDDGVTYTNDVDAEVQALWTVSFGFLVSVGGTGNAITATSDAALVAAIAAYARPMGFYYVPTAANTAAATINIDAVGVISIKDKLGNALAGGEFAVGGLYPLVFDGTNLRAITITSGAANTETTAPDIILQDQKTSGTAGGTFTSGAYRQRTLTTAVRNVISGASLASNQITLPAGTYYAEWRAPAASVSYHQSRLYNATDSALIAYGSSAYCGAGVQSGSVGQAVFTLTSSKAIELDHQCSSTEATNGFGLPASFNTEIYAELRIWKQ
jgi:hypothetical protein